MLGVLVSFVCILALKALEQLVYRDVEAVDGGCHGCAYRAR